MAVAITPITDYDLLASFQHERALVLEDAGRGVPSAARKSGGRVFDLQGPYVADAAIFAFAVDAKPVAIICTVSEVVAEGVTGMKPDADH